MKLNKLNLLVLICFFALIYWFVFYGSISFPAGSVVKTISGPEVSKVNTAEFAMAPEHQKISKLKFYSEKKYYIETENNKKITISVEYLDKDNQPKAYEQDIKLSHVAINEYQLIDLPIEVNKSLPEIDIKVKTNDEIPSGELRISDSDHPAQIIYNQDIRTVADESLHGFAKSRAFFWFIFVMAALLVLSISVLFVLEEKK